MAIGGGDFADSPILERISAIAKENSDARMLVMTVATNHDDSVAAKYHTLFRKAGFRHVAAAKIVHRCDAVENDVLAKMEKADAVFFTGGDQLNVTTLFGGTPLHQLMRQRQKAGIPVIGTSAGAAMMSSSMILSGESSAPPKAGGIELGPGLDLVNDSIIDSHFTQRGRHGRLLTAVAHYPHVLGIGIDESTAAIFHNGTFEVTGSGSVTVVDGHQMTYSDLPYKKVGEGVCMHDLVLHILSDGQSFDLVNGRPMPSDDQQKRAAR